MSREEFIKKSNPYKKTISDGEKLASLLNKKINALRLKVKADDKDDELVISYQFELKEIHLKVAYDYLMMNRLSEKYLSIKSDASIEKIRKNLVLLIGIWEKEFGDAIHEITQRDYLEVYQNLIDNEKIIKHFKLIGLLTDKLLFLIDPTVKWYWTAVDIKIRTLITFCNAIDFKLMLKEYNPELSKYHFYQKTYRILMVFSEECIDLLWTKHHLVVKQKRTVTDIQMGLGILGFFIHLEKIFKETAYLEKYTKKKQAWENYRKSLLKDKK